MNNTQPNMDLHINEKQFFFYHALDVSRSLLFCRPFVLCPKKKYIVCSLWAQYGFTWGLNQEIVSKYRAMYNRLVESE
jgi:hypothetical protein